MKRETSKVCYLIVLVHIEKMGSTETLLGVHFNVEDAERHMEVASINLEPNETVSCFKSVLIKSYSSDSQLSL